MKRNQSTPKEISTTEYFQLGDNLVQKVELHHTFQPERGLTREQHLDTMYHDFVGVKPTHHKITDVAHLVITGTQQIPKGFSA